VSDGNVAFEKERGGGGGRGVARSTPVDLIVYDINRRRYAVDKLS